MSRPQIRRSKRKLVLAAAVLGASVLAGVVSSSPTSFSRRQLTTDQEAAAAAAAAENLILKLISAQGPYSTATLGNPNAIASAVGQSGDLSSSSPSFSSPDTAAAAVTDVATTDYSTLSSSTQQQQVASFASPTSNLVQAAVQAPPTALSVAASIVADTASSSFLAPAAAIASDVAAADTASLSSSADAADPTLTSWTYIAGAFGCPGAENGQSSAATLCSVNIPSPTDAPAQISDSNAQNQILDPASAVVVASGATLPPSVTQRRRGNGNAMSGPRPTPDPHVVRRQNAAAAAAAASVASAANALSSSLANLFPQFTSYVSLPDPSTTRLDFGPTSNLNTSTGKNNGSGNGQAPSNINNPNSPDLGWLDIQVGGVPYKNGDLIASIVWVLATIALIPLLLIRLLRRSSLISMVLITIMVFMALMLVAFGLRAKLANDTPTTPTMNVEGIILAILLPLLLEPLLSLLSLYSQQSGRTTGVPQATFVLRFLNLVVFLLFLVAAAYYASWLDSWNKALQLTQTAQDLPPIVPPNVTRIAPVVGSIVELILILGAALLIPVARGDSGNMRPGGYIFLLLLLLFIATVYRTLQSLHATTRLSAEQGGSLNSNDLLPFFQGGSSSSTTDNQRVAQGLSLAPQGMYGPTSNSNSTGGIDWQQLQLTMASRNTPQTPLIFNLVYILPMWLMVFLLFFAHAPGKKKDDQAENGNVAVAKA